MYVVNSNYVSLKYMLKLKSDYKSKRETFQRFRRQALTPLY